MPFPYSNSKSENNDNGAEEEDELDALRKAALLSIRPKKSAFKVQAHPVRNNLLSIIPVEDGDEEINKKPEFKKLVKPSSFNSRGQHPVPAAHSELKFRKNPILAGQKTHFLTFSKVQKHIF